MSEVGGETDAKSGRLSKTSHSNILRFSVCRINKIAWQNKLHPVPESFKIDINFILFKIYLKKDLRKKS